MASAYCEADVQTTNKGLAVKPAILILSVLCFALILASTANADTFAFSYSYDGVFASGSFDADPLAPGQVLITSITGQRNGVEIASLDAPGTFGDNDNLLSFPDEPYLTFSGVSFQDADGLNYNLYFDQESYRESLDGYTTGVPMILTIESIPEAVPEPSSLALLGSGLLGSLSLVRRRFHF